jgi:hypothetical protein
MGNTHNHRVAFHRLAGKPGRLLLGLTGAALALVGVTPAFAGGPPIAYAKGSRTSVLYLANADGSAAKVLYKAPSGKKIFSLAVRHGGNELAFEQVDCCSSTGTSTVKIVQYDNAGVRIGTPKSQSVSCRVGSLDYHPADGTLLVVSGCNGQLSRLNTGTMTSTQITTGRRVSKAAWMSASKVFMASSPDLYTFDVSAPSALTKIVANEDAVVTVDAAADGSRGVISTSQFPDRVKLVTPLAAGAAVSEVVRGSSPGFSPDGQKIIYIAGTGRTQTIRVRPISTGTGEQVITGQGIYSSVAWAGSAATATTAAQTDFAVRSAP